MYSFLLIFIFHFCLRALREKRREATMIGTCLTVKRDPVQTLFVYKDMPEQYFFYSSVLVQERSRQHHSKICVNIFSPLRSRDINCIPISSTQRVHNVYPEYLFDVLSCSSTFSFFAFFFFLLSLASLQISNAG